MRRAVAAVVAGLLGALAAMAGAGAATSTTTTTTAPSRPALRLTSQTPWVTTSQPFVVHLATSTLPDLAALDLVVDLYAPVRTRSAFQQTLDGRGLGRATKEYVVSLSPPANANDVTVTLPLPQLDVAPTDTTLPSLDRGVYPISFAIRAHGGAAVTTTLTTHLVRIPDAPADRPLDVAWIQPVSAPPTGGKDLPDADRSAIGALLAALAANPSLPMTLDLTPETVAALGPADLQVLRALLDPTHPLLSAPFVDVDPTALVGAGQGDDLSRQLDTGDDALFRSIGARGDLHTWSIEHPLSTGALARLRSLSATRLVLPESTLRPITRSQTLTNPYSLDAGDGDVLEAVSADDGLAAHFRNQGDQVLAAHQLLADLAVVYGDAPSVPHGVVVRPPATWRPNAAFLGAVLPALTGSSIVRPVILDGLFGHVPLYTSNGRSLVRSLATTTRPGALPVARLARAHATVDQLVGLLGPTTAEASAMRRLLLSAESTRLSTRGRDAVLDTVEHALARVRDNVRVPNRRTIRLTARSGTVPLNVANDNPFAVHVDIVLSSDKLEFTDVRGDDRSREVLTGVVIGANATLTRAVPVKSRASAAFSMQVVVRAPTGQEIERSRFTIISTVFSGVGVVLSIGAALFLALWWIRNWRTSRRDVAH